MENGKSVRFLNATPKDTKSDGEDNEDEEEDGTVQVKIAGITFDESKMKIPVVHTPIPKHASFRMSQENDDSDEESYLAKFNKTPPLPTPMAMRDISKRAQEALAQLYLDDADQEEEQDGLQPKALFTNDECYDDF